MYSRAYSVYIFFVLLIKTILNKQLRKTLKSAKMIYICIFYLKSLETYVRQLCAPPPRPRMMRVRDFVADLAEASIGFTEI